MTKSILSHIAQEAGVSPARLVAEMANNNTSLTNAFTEAGNGGQHHSVTLPSHAESARFIAGLVDEHTRKARAQALSDPATLWQEGIHKPTKVEPSR